MVHVRMSFLAEGYHFHVTGVGIVSIVFSKCISRSPVSYVFPF
jgi:hypothetical protein